MSPPAASTSTGVSHVINYECPDGEEDLPAPQSDAPAAPGLEGVAMTLVDWEDIARWKMINKALGLAFDEPVETYSSSRHLPSELSTPEGTKGRSPRAAHRSG